MSSHATSKGSSAWTGWAAFAGVIILISGIFSLLQGLVLLLGPRASYVVVDGSLFLFDVAGWAWWHIIIGALLTITAFALFSGAVWARVIAVILAVLSAAGQLLVLPAQPWWSVIVIAIDVLIIYALTAHGHELSERRTSSERGAVV
ncbi:hypothetical protein [Microbacterium sp. WCS2018Hpa-9]|uniref:DUF7144 family membrane protein n=1 Tax=Microbacterium sp. WCS2018Hpa-9 TaxID=3073635 RepID=UPI0028893F63|nr:hypothetical protein [Microbacterium sp. WCS2018Hpa-9]